MYKTILLIAALAAASACSAVPTAPGNTAHDDPPATECRSGWQNVAGEWVCYDP